MENAIDYIFAGRAVVTIQSLASGKHYTFKVKSSDNPNMFFVQLLVGPDNTADYVYAGLAFKDTLTTRTSAKSSPGASKPLHALQWALRHPESDQLTIQHEGHCGACGRTLTTPESLACGLGPVCREKL